MSRLVMYYREFNKDVIAQSDQCISMLGHMVKYGDENLAVYEYRFKNPGKAELPQDLKDREAHKYELYAKFDKIVFNELDVVEIEFGNDENNGKSIDIDWSQIDTSNFTVEDQS